MESSFPSDFLSCQKQTKKWDNDPEMAESDDGTVAVAHIRMQFCDVFFHGLAEWFASVAHFLGEGGDAL